MKGIYLAVACVFAAQLAHARTSIVFVEDGSATGQKAGYELSGEYWVESSNFKVSTVLKVPYPAEGAPVYSTYF